MMSRLGLKENYARHYHVLLRPSSIITYDWEGSQNSVSVTNYTHVACITINYVHIVKITY